MSIEYGFQVDLRLKYINKDIYIKSHLKAYPNFILRLVLFSCGKLFLYLLP